MAHALEAQHALGGVLAGDLGVGLGEPDHRQQLVELDAVADGVAQRDRLPAAGAPDHHPVGRETTHRRPGRGLLVARRGVEEGLQVEALLGGDRLEDRQRLLTERRIDAHESDLLALQPRLLLVGDVFQDHGRLRPVEGAGRKDGREDLAVGGVGAAVEERQDVHLVLERPRHDRARDRRRQEVHQHRAVGLETVVGLDATLRLVAGIDHGRLELVALDAATAVDQGQVVALALVIFGRDEGVDLGEILGEAELDDLVLGPGTCRAERQCA